MAEKFIGMVAVKAIIVHDKKVLLMQNSFDHKWQFPGGTMHVGEKPEQTLKRELMEELCLDIRPIAVQKADIFDNPNGGPRLVLLYLCELLGDPTTLEGKDAEVEQVRWVGIDEVDSLDIWPEYVAPIRAALGQ